METIALNEFGTVWTGESSQTKRHTALYNEVLRLQRMLREQAAVIEDLQRRATEDGLTGLLNRRGFDIALDEALSDFNRYGHHAALLMLDMNEFKAINDQLGHLAGDALLRHVAQILTCHTRESDIVARLGGDEFAIILKENAAEHARRKGRELEAIIAASPCCYEGREISAFASIGACTFMEADNKTDLMARADANMYRRKADLKTLKTSQ